MKKLLFICAIALVGLQMANAQTSTVPTAPEATTAAVPIDSVAQMAVTVVAIEPQYATDSALQAVVTSVDGLQQTMYDNYNSLRQSQNSGLKSRDVIPLIALVVSLTGLVIIVFAVLKYRFKNRDMRYRFEMERLEKFPTPAAPEPKVELYRPNADTGDYPTRLIKKLMLVCFVCLGFFLFMGITACPYGFFGWMLMFVSIAGFGYATVHLYLEYMKRCDRKSE